LREAERELKGSGRTFVSDAVASGGFGANKNAELSEG